MQHGTLGTTDLEIAPLVLGGNVFGWTADERTSFRILDAMLDRGLNAIDTADVYSVWVDGKCRYDYDAHVDGLLGDGRGEP